MPSTAQTVVCIAGSGFRVLPLLSVDHIKTLYIVDQSAVQLEHVKSVLRLLKEADYESFVQAVNPTSKASRLYKGSHERSYLIRSRLLRIFFGSQFQGGVDLTASKRWPLFVKLYSYLLKQTKSDHSDGVNYADYVRMTFQRLMRTAYSKNFFWQQLIKGHAETVEAFAALISERTWRQAKANFSKIEIHYVNQDINDFLSSKKNEIDFISYSNVLNYLSPMQKMKMMASVPRALTNQGQILFRSYINEIQLVTDQLKEITNKTDILENEMTGSYQIKIYEKI
jgi:S-adenosylmethionine:diacylglycerol 3-amino-3-carboxypropyl transferase